MRVSFYRESVHQPLEPLFPPLPRLLPSLTFMKLFFFEFRSSQCEYLRHRLQKIQSYVFRSNDDDASPYF